ncbi:hypothetical protein L1987_77914 [Smallanthus sonchifolius]|uniref:Uncharacterized protein n=1 Tax=Smallanthus sonchifolius TaxID=185202 RepID=A0ACB8ZFP0_9ASTR|nr:hypothetical protein L1987_77914 [Smallanthus sonchifolius]
MGAGSIFSNKKHEKKSSSDALAAPVLYPDDDKTGSPCFVERTPTALERISAAVRGRLRAALLERVEAVDIQLTLTDVLIDTMIDDMRSQWGYSSSDDNMDLVKPLIPSTRQPIKQPIPSTKRPIRQPTSSTRKPVAQSITSTRIPVKVTVPSTKRPVIPSIRKLKSYSSLEVLMLAFVGNSGLTPTIAKEPETREFCIQAAGALMFAALLSLTKWIISFFEEEEVEVPVSKEHRERWRLIKLRDTNPELGQGIPMGFQFPVSITPVDEVSTNETDVTENGAQATGGYPVRMEADAEAAGALMFAALLSLTKWINCHLESVGEVSTNETDVTENGAQATGGNPVQMEADAEAFDVHCNSFFPLFIVLYGRLYAFDVHCSSFFPLFIMLYVLHFLSITSSGSSWLRSTFAVKFDSYGGCILRSLPQPFRLYSDKMIFQRLQREFEAALASQTQGGYGVLDDQIFTSGLYGICTGGYGVLDDQIFTSGLYGICTGYQKRQEAVSPMFETAQLRLYAFDVHCNSFFTLFIVLYGSVASFREDHFLPVSNWDHHHPYTHLDSDKMIFQHLQTEFEAAPASQMQGRVASTVDAVLLSHPDTKHLGVLQYAVNNLDFLLQFMQQNQFFD